MSGKDRLDIFPSRMLVYVSDVSGFIILIINIKTQ